ncbi:MAG: transcriptional regulator, partial [Chitinophagaceae bacterium]
MFCRRLLLPILIMVCSFSKGQSYIGLRQVRNFQKQDYNGGSQNWNIRQDSAGILYFANNEGLLSFDGTYWNLFPLSNKTIVRSIEITGDKKIYVGGQDELGYFAPGRNGSLVYTSLKSLIPMADQQFADIWDIVANGDDVFFRSSQKIFRYSKGKMMVYRPQGSWLFLGIVNDRLMAQDEKTGLLAFN